MIRRTCAVLGIATAIFAVSIPAQNARPAIGDTVTTATGLRYVFTKQGDGLRPNEGDVMIIHGIGLHTNGKEFWNTRTENAPYEYTPGVDRVIKGFDEGMRGVREGDRIVITMKPELAYGARGSGANIPPNSTLIFDYEILAVKPLSIARLLRDTTVVGGIDTIISRAKRLPNLKDYYVSAGGIQSLTNASNRRVAGDGEKVLAFGLTLLPESYRLHAALARAQARRGARNDAIRSYEQALTLNKQSTDAEKSDFATTTDSLAALKRP
jgi:hypothetical protein